MSWRYVTIDKASTETGYTERAIKTKINRGIWLEGREYVRAPDKNKLIDLDWFYEEICKSKYLAGEIAKLSGKPKKAGFIYIVTTDHKTTSKIGFAQNVDKRVTALQTGNAQRLKVAHVVPACNKTERIAHAIASDYRANGEWFHISASKAHAIVRLARIKVRGK